MNCEDRREEGTDVAADSGLQESTDSDVGSVSDLLPQTPEEAAALTKIFECLNEQFHIDFSHYRETTVLRRLTRRIALTRCDGFDSYLAYLNERGDERESLCDDLLLSFTEFFRDPHVFVALREQVFPRLVQGRSARSPIRIWVPGCSTGEEVYSIAICLYEFLEESHTKVPFQLFGTDLVERHVQKARSGLYSEGIVRNVSEPRLERFFDKTKEGFKVIRHIREMCVFAAQDITRDPPFPKIDLVSCRNVLIYFDAAFQDAAIPMFYFALNPSGYLLLGSSETMGRFPDLFSAVDVKHNLYVKRTTLTKPSLRFPVHSATAKARPQAFSAAVASHGRGDADDMLHQIQRLLIEQYAPPGVLVDGGLQIRRFYGHTSPYLEPAYGDASLKLSRMARDGLMPDLFVAIENARRTNAKVGKKGVAFRREDEFHDVDISVTPIEDSRTGETHFLVVFEPPATARGPEASSPSVSPPSDERDELERLREELHATKAHLQSIIEEKDDVNQELWAANEEIQSTNEELQSVNEELEAAKEELESSNEELLTLNETLKRKNLDLVAAEERTRNTLDILSDSQGVARIGTWWIELPSGQMHWTAETYRIFGYEQRSEPPTVEMALARIHPNERALIEAKARTPLDSFEPASRCEFHVVLPNREVRVVEGQARNLLDESGVVTRLIGTVQDVTERKRAEYSLRQRDEKFRIAIEASAGAYFELSGDFKFGVISDEWAQCFGLCRQDLPPDEEVLSWWFSRVHPEDVDQVSTAFMGFVAGHTEYFQSEYRAKHRSGGWVWLSTRAGALQRDESGRVVQMAGLCFDITERRCAAHALEESEARFKSYVEHAPDGIFVADAQGVYVEVNDAACRITGYPRDELIGMHLTSLVHPDDHECAKRHFEGVVREGRASAEVRAIYRDGRERAWLVEAVKMTDTRFLGFVKDLTEHKSMADQLRQAEKLQAVGQLAGGIAHDFNNQLTGILGYAEFLREEAAHNPLLVQYAESVILGVKRASDLTAQLLAFSRKGKFLTTTVDVHRLVFEVVNLLNHSIDKRITIHQELRANPSMISGDPTQLQNSILNLALNARDAMRNGGNLTFKTDVRLLDAEFCRAQAAEIPPGKYLMLSVADTGTGMDRNTQAHIFEPFFTTKQEGQGTGMGLAAVYGVVKSHRGAIIVESEVGKGSTFHLYFPSIAADQHRDGADTHSPKPVADMVRVLLVEDEALVREVAVRMLQRIGCKVSACANGLEAKEHYSANWQEIDLVILDVVMPKMDGEETFVALREVNPQVIVLVSSGYSVDGKAQRIIDLGAKGFVQKPYRLGELSAKITEVFSRSRCIPPILPGR